MYYGKHLREIASAIRQVVGLSRDLHSISESLNDHAVSVRAADDCKKQRQKIQQEWFEKSLAEYKQSKRDKASDDDRNFRVQKSLRNATWLAFLAAAIYASIAACQLREMRKSTEASATAADAATSAAKTAATELALTKSRIEGQEQAIVELKYPDLDIRSGTAGVTLSNSGQTTANNVHADFSITRESLPERKIIWKSAIYTLEISRLVKGAVISKDYPVPGISLDNWPIDPEPPFMWTQTIVVDGAFGYENGFGTQVKQRFCEAYVRYSLKSGSDTKGRNGWVPCDELRDTGNAVYAQWRQQTQDKQK